MKKGTIILCLVCLMLAIMSCGNNAASLEGGIDVPEITVGSDSITSDGKLLTACAADKAPNDPRGANQSPQLSWDAVDGAGCYAAVMFDEDASWLHFLVTDIEQTSLEQGAYTSTDVYVGPYPPKTAGRHNYRIEVFALKQAPDEAAGKMDAVNQYAGIIDALDAPGDNILARGHVVGTYANGDDTV